MSIILDATNGITTPEVFAVNGVSGTPCFSAYQSTAQLALVPNTWTRVSLQTKEFDTTSAFDNVTNFRFQPTVAGYYWIFGSVQVQTATSSITSGIYKNGALFKAGLVVSNSQFGSVVSSLINLNGSTDYIEFWTNSSVANLIISQVTNTYFQGFLARAL